MGFKLMIQNIKLLTFKFILIYRNRTEEMNMHMFFMLPISKYLTYITRKSKGATKNKQICSRFNLAKSVCLSAKM